MSSRKEKWFMIKSSNGGHEVVNYRAVVSSDCRIGSDVVINKPNGQQDTATIIGSSRDRQLLEQQIAPIAPVPRLYEDNTETVPQHAGAGPAGLCFKHEDIGFGLGENGDFSASDESDWAPSNEHSTDEDDVGKKVENRLKRIRRSYSNKRTCKIMKPSHRADAVVTSLNNKKRRRQENPIKMYEKLKRGEDSYRENMKSLPDSTRTNNSPAPTINNNVNENVLTQNVGTVAINVQDILNMKQCFDELFKILSELKPTYNMTAKENGAESEPVPSEEMVQDTQPNLNVKSEKSVAQNIPQDFDEYEYRSDEICNRSDESQRSDDNVLITNKYHIVGSKAQEPSKNKKGHKSRTTNKQDSMDSSQTRGKRVMEMKHKVNDSNKGQEWIRIGSGKTLMHKDQYRKVNWKSYTIATRTLLLALFPRRILATHSMTGKRSPAFQDKPAKMCLDPKIVSDVIIEITERFQVKENLVRSIITTKCADECKMMRMRAKRQTLPNQENVSPSGSDDGANQTC